MATTDEIGQRIAELGDWFQNLDLRGHRTAPNHALGDYPAFKWRQFEHVTPRDLRGRTVLDVGCNAGFHSIAMKQRGADRVVGIDWDERYLAQARLASEVGDVDIAFRNLSVYDVAMLEERFDVVLRIPFVQANLIDASTDEEDAVERWRTGLQQHGVWANMPVPLFPYPGSPDHTKLWGTPDARACDRAVDYSLAQHDRFSDIQDERPLPLEDLELEPAESAERR